MSTQTNTLCDPSDKGCCRSLHTLGRTQDAFAISKQLRRPVIAVYERAECRDAGSRQETAATSDNVRHFSSPQPAQSCRCRLRGDSTDGCREAERDYSTVVSNGCNNLPRYQSVCTHYAAVHWIARWMPANSQAFNCTVNLQLLTAQKIAIAEISAQC